jgi:RimJ/RimL family protein N-acetyltransferase
MTNTVELLDVSRADHSGFVYDLAMACKEELLNDFESDIIVFINQAQRKIASGYVHAFMCKVDGEAVGSIWVERDDYGIGYVRFGVLPEARNAFKAKWFLAQFLGYCFGALSLRKVVSLFEPAQRPMEKLLRDLGFRKEGFFRAELMRHGEPVDIVRLGLLKETYDTMEHDKT